MELPYVDEHAVRVAAPREAVWAAVQRQAAAMTGTRGSWFTRLLGTEPAAGFAVAGHEPDRQVSLVGRHRFSRYRLDFEVAEGDGGATWVRARTYAAFPGLHGRAYRALVIGSRVHVVATRRLLGKIARDAYRRAAGDASAASARQSGA